MKTRLNQLRQGSTLFMAIGVATLLLIVVLGVSRMINAGIQSVNRAEMKNISYFVAEGEIERAILEVSDKQYGYETHTDFGDGQDYKNIYPLMTESRYKAIAMATNTGAGSTYSVPAKGYGTLGGAACDGSKYALQNPDCEWNILAGPQKMYLYDLTRQNWNMNDNVHTTIKTKSGKAIKTETMNFGVGVDSPVNDPVIVNWKFLDHDNSLDTFDPDYCTYQKLYDQVIARANPDKLSLSPASLNCGAIQNRSPQCPLYHGTNTQIKSSFISPEYSFDTSSTTGYNKEVEVCLDPAHKSQLRINNFLSSKGLTIYNLEPVLYNLRNVDGEKEDYLIYKIEADAPITDANTYIEAEGVSGNFPLQHRQRIVTRLPNETQSGAFSFAFFE